ncbi:hypothetical protein CISIN_1g024317mg [Citrus sinensis]|uniref:Strictosidine synthase conserved region domain-containing protein n=1 Tax=Citrus sinensis TaxID=2711 RepID=A0A067GUZ8_CITSI|nr:hypothetical protein CISIN_1g024317mg [Citrus sinensis]
MASHFVYSSLAITLLSLLFSLVSSGLLLEDGYTVTTVIDGHQLEINPHSVIDRPGSSDLIVLDSSRSAFYTLSFPLSEESVVKRLAGDGVQGYSDGEPGSARFDKPKSFAVDMKGNIYVADKSNHVIRKITNLDHGNQLIRQINLKPEDCSKSSQSGSGMFWVTVFSPYLISCKSFWVHLYLYFCSFKGSI